MKILLINKENPVPEWYKPMLDEVQNGYLMEKHAAVCMREMIECAKKDGVELKIFSAYRSPEYQQKLLNEDIKRYMNEGMSYEEAFQTSVMNIALPGTSEHNAGLAADICNVDWEDEITEEFENTPEFIWLDNNAYKFGFILRNPKGKTHITKYNYEPWHYRFVGCPHAEIIKRKNITLEEYLQPHYKRLNKKC